MVGRIVKGRVVRAAAAALCVALNVLGACSTETTNAEACLPGDLRDCACAGGVVGWQQCSDDGRAYAAPDAGGECNCTGVRPGTCVAGAPVACDLVDGLLPFMCPCTTDEQCSTAKCGIFPAKGNRCTRPCTAATTKADCPSPSCTCNNQGVCKAP
jgi:hypothetical protein